MAQNIRLAVLGATGSGKSSLVSQIHGRCLQADKDGRIFRLAAAELHNAPVELWTQFQFALVLFDLHDTNLAALALARAIAQTAPHHRMVSVIGTKRDSIPQDYSDRDLRIRNYSSYFAFYEDLQYFSTSSVTQSGIDDVLHFIAAQLHPPPRRELRPSLFNLAGIWILDLIASVFSLGVPANVNYETPDPFQLDEATVDALVKTPEALAWDRKLSAYATHMFSLHGSVPAHKITPTLIAKYASPSERENMAYVREHTTIPVPQPRYRHMKDWLVMELVEGKMLAECWDSQSILMKFRIACTLRRYISQLRGLTGTIPGTVLGGAVSGVLFEDEDRGPFDTSTQFGRYCEHVAHSGWTSVVAHRMSSDPSYRVPPEPVTIPECPLVFTHGDLNMTNIILSSDGVLWLVDWATSGFFPPWLETVGLKFYDDRTPKSWQYLRSFIAGSYPDYESLWDYFLEEAYRFRRLRGQT